MRHTLVLSALLGTGLLAATSISQAANNSLVFCSEGSPAGFDTAQYTTATDNDAAEPLYNRLAEFEKGATNVVPGLATSWDISEDGLKYTFHLRQGVKFHTTKYFTPTRDFNADDVLFTFNRMLDPQQPFRKAYPTDSRIQRDEPEQEYRQGRKDRAADRGHYAQQRGRRVHPEHRHEFRRHPFRRIRRQAAGRGQAERHQPEADRHRAVRVQELPERLEHPLHRQQAVLGPDRVKLDNLIFAINTDASVRVQKLKANKCQITLHPRPADVTALKNDPALQLIEKPGFNLGYIAYNVRHKPFDQLEVRQALDMAVNKQGILNAVYQGAGQLAVNAMPPTQWSYDETIKDAAYNPEKAKELLKAAGVKEGTEITLWAMPVQRPYNPNAKLMAEMLQADWAKIGLKVKIVSYEWGEYIKRTKNGEHDISLIGWTGDNGDPDNWLGTLYSCDAIGGNNYSMWCDPAYDKLIKQAKVVTDHDQRTVLYKQAQQYLKQQVPITPVAHSTVNQPLAPKSKGSRSALSVATCSRVSASKNKTV